MAVFTSAAMSLRKKIIIDSLKNSGATNPESAKTLDEAGVVNPDLFPEYTEQLVYYEFIHKTADGKYWIDEGKGMQS